MGPFLTTILPHSAPLVLLLVPKSRFKLRRRVRTVECGAPPEAKPAMATLSRLSRPPGCKFGRADSAGPRWERCAPSPEAIVAGSSSLPGLALSLTSLCPGAGFLAGKWPVFSRLTPCRPLIHGKDYRSLLGPQPTLALLAQRSQSPEDPPHRNQR